MKRPQPDADCKSAYIVRVRFCDTDLMGIVHHAKYLEYFEAGRVEYMHRRGIGFSSFEWRDQIAQRQAKAREGRLRYAERAAYYPAEVVIASFVLWLRRDPQDGPPR